MSSKIVLGSSSAVLEKHQDQVYKIQDAIPSVFQVGWFLASFIQTKICIFDTIFNTPSNVNI